MGTRKIILTIFFLSIFLVAGCGKDEIVNPGVSIVVINESISTNMPVPTETGIQETEVFQDKSDNVKEFSIIAKDFEFIPGTITVNKGDSVRLNIKSEDTVHGISIPDFNVKKDIPAMEEVSVEFVADKSGTFPFKCSVYCGDGHRDMKGTLIVN